MLSDRRHPLTEAMELEIRKFDKLTHAPKVVALCLPPVAMSLIGLAVLSRTKGGVTVPVNKPLAPTPRPAPRSGG